MEIAPGVYSLSQLKGAFVHAYLVEGDDGLALIDTLYDTDAQQILDLIRRIGKNVSDLKHIILTHAHRSHLGGMARLKQLSSAPVYAHAWEADIISGDRKAQCVSRLPQKPVVTYPLQLALNLGVVKHPPSEVDRFLGDGDRAGPVEVLHTPGHSPGHLAFYLPERRVLFTGDAIVTWPELMLGWGGFMLNARQQRTSVRRIAELDFEVLASGHGDAITEHGAERLRAVVEEVYGA